MSGFEVHLCGSIPLADAREVFTEVAARLGGRVRRIPDGETGDRLSWLGWQNHVFDGDAQFEAIASEGDPRNATAVIEAVQGTMDIKHTTWFRLKDGVDPKSLTIRKLDYAANAIASYKEFAALKTAGKFAADQKFLVSVPSPFNILNSAIAPDDRIRVEPAFEARMRREVEETAAAIPHGDLAWQWDVAHDMQAFDGARKTYFSPAKEGLVARLARVGGFVPADVDLGYHLCYGSFGGKHFVEPKDMAAMVELSNALSATAVRRIDWIHMPVPIERDDDAYFAPLKNLKLRPETKLFLGLIHDKDGEAGTRRRIATADKYVSGYGIATECGFGRRPARTARDLIDLHATLAGAA